MQLVFDNNPIRACAAQNIVIGACVTLFICQNLSISSKLEWHCSFTCYKQEIECVRFAKKSSNL